MKFGCVCGNTIFDQSDFLPYKGHIISDQDWFDFLNLIEASILIKDSDQKVRESRLMGILSMTSKLFRQVYECNKCGRVFITDNDNKLICYEPYDASIKSIMKSVYGDTWKRPLIGSWSGKEGFISYVVGGSTFNNWEVLETKYYEHFNEFKNKDILRSAILRKDNEMIHSWTNNKNENN